MNYKWDPQIQNGGDYGRYPADRRRTWWLYGDNVVGKFSNAAKVAPMLSSFGLKWRGKSACRVECFCTYLSRLLLPHALFLCVAATNSKKPMGINNGQWRNLKKYHASGGSKV